MENIESKRVYTSFKKICAEECYMDLFPLNLSTYEEWYFKIKNSYYKENNVYSVDFNFLSTECGSDCLEPCILGLSKKRKLMKN